MVASSTDAARFDGHITFLPVTDLDASRVFYRDVLGLEITTDQGSCLIFRAAADSFIGVCERTDAMASAGVIITLVADDVDGWAQRLSDAGAAIVSGPDHSATYGIYHVFFHDPDGHLLEIQRFDDPDWASGAG